MIPLFSKYNLALIVNGQLMHFSKRSGIRPIAECVHNFKGKLEKCELHDKVIGLAAARLIVYSGIAKIVVTKVCSLEARNLLEGADISCNAEEFVDNILNMDKSEICPMEELAMKINDNEKFFERIRELLLI